MSVRGGLVWEEREEIRMVTDLERDVVPLAENTGQLDDGLHALYLTFDDDVEVFLLDLREQEEVDGPGVSRPWILRDERSEGLVQVFGDERGV